MSNREMCFAINTHTVHKHCVNMYVRTYIRTYMIYTEMGSMECSSVCVLHGRSLNMSTSYETYLGQLLGNVSSNKHSLQVHPEVLYLHPRLKDFCSVGELGDPVLDVLLEGGIVPGVDVEGRATACQTTTRKGFQMCTWNCCSTACCYKDHAAE